MIIQRDTLSINLFINEHSIVISIFQRSKYMDDQEWTLTWDDEDIVEDFSEILQNEKKLLRLVTSLIKIHLLTSNNNLILVYTIIFSRDANSQSEIRSLTAFVTLILFSLNS